MPKMKTNSAAKKRVRVTGSGKLMHDGAGMRHNLEHKSAKKRRDLSRDSVLATAQSKSMRKLLGR
ncbi:50S ribosomal protein L35 [Bifidobacterium bombi]|uniref:Large ribosomal subunit protein bL35 n=1 Tax=Bifidobacterium bombi DSM 19703 TaxID=1341695 RepID=A0A080N6A1_9BIFI|nr:50S ribosomal protein L35 [Bifidobacterium bombi]KFF31419.1 50S ribosomal protein L35 [Bifidobacterium bombi DSM 19703]